MQIDGSPQSLQARARRLLRSCRYGVLSTHSQRVAGFPFGSVVPYMVALDGFLIILISRLAEHTRNIAADPRVSLTAFEPIRDVQAESRITVLGRCERTALDDVQRTRYARLFPSSDAYLALDFEFHRIEPTAARFIGGFGSVGWIDLGLILPATGFALRESELIARINEKEEASLRAHCARLTGTVPQQAHVVAIDPDGLDVAADGVVLRLEFPVPCDDSNEIPQATASLLGVAAN